MARYKLTLGGKSPITDLPSMLGLTSLKFYIKDWELKGTLVCEGEMIPGNFKGENYFLVFLDMDMIENVNISM